jgi:hypothetical protein
MYVLEHAWQITAFYDPKKEYFSKIIYFQYKLFSACNSPYTAVCYFMVNMTNAVTFRNTNTKRHLTKIIRAI